MKEGRTTPRGLKADLVREIRDADLLFLWDVRKRIREVGEGRSLGDWRCLVWLHGHRQAHAIDRLKARELKRRITHLETENRLRELETENKQLVNDALRERKDGPTENDFLREAAELQKVEVGDSERESYYAMIEAHPIPSPQEDQDALDAETLRGE